MNFQPELSIIKAEYNLLCIYAIINLYYYLSALANCRLQELFYFFNTIFNRIQFHMFLQHHVILSFSLNFFNRNSSSELSIILFSSII